MQEDFHYYATYVAAILAEYPHDEALAICYSDQFVDLCSRSLLSKLKAPLSAATTQLQHELVDARTDLVGLQDITRIWASFHFLPQNLEANPERGSRRYRDTYRLICGPNGALVRDTVELALGRGPQAAGIALHVLADTWAHRNFAGTPSLVINNVSGPVDELVDVNGTTEWRPIHFRHSTGADDLDRSIFTNTLYRSDEHSIMNLGHGRAGHLPDYSFARYRYLPAWGGYEEIIKDNPSDYYHAFCQMVYALRYLRGAIDCFETDRYDEDVVAPWHDEIMHILTTRQLDACADWKALGERVSGQEVVPFDLDQYQGAYLDADPDAREDTFLGQFFLAALAQKSMVTNRIHRSGNLLAGFSVDYDERGFKGIKDFMQLVEYETIGSMR